jgi:ABC-type antimicrobial peptide transport system permease subunit
MSTSTSNSSSTGGGIGFAGLLTIVFIVLKLTHVIDWSWWWVLSPLWIGFALFLVIAVIAIALIGSRR